MVGLHRNKCNKFVIIGIEKSKLELWRSLKMKRGIAKYTAFCLAAGFMFSQSGMLTMAAGSDLVLVGLGTAEKAQATQTVEGTVVEEQAQPEETDADVTEDTAAEEPVEETEVPEEEETEAKAEVDRDAIGTTGFAQCEEYLNVRTDSSTDSEVVGKIYPNGSLEIIDADDNGWYYVRSGNVEGYVAAQYVATGDEAQSIADTAGYTTAQVGAEVLNMRASADEDGEIIGAIYEADEVEVVEDCGDWVKVVAGDGTYGYVSADYVQTNTFYATGETLEEEQARLDQEWLDYLAQQEAEQAAAEAAYIASLGYTENYSYSEPSYGYSDAQAAADAAAYEAQAWAADAASASYDAQANADAQYQAYLDAQAAADAATQSTDEESIYAAAAEAQAAYEAYLSAQAEADAAAQAEADAAYAAQAAAEAAENVEDTYYEDTYTDDTYYDDSYTEDTYTEDTYNEDTEDGYSEQSYSSVGQQIADYAVQFVGNPYVWGGTSLTNGADCSGFVLSVFANFGISLPHSAAAQSGYGTAVSGDSLQPGDLLFYGDGSGIGHVSIYIGNGQVVHASSSTTGIIISSVGYRTPCAYRRLV